MTTIAQRARDYVITGPTKDRPVVELWSSRRLSFEPKGWMKQMRDELRAALRALPAESGRVLDAVYASGDTDFFDVENVLFYNVGSGAFGHLTRRGLRFQRDRRPVARLPGALLDAHYHRYELTTVSLEPNRGARLGAFRFELPALATDTKPHSVWWALRNGDVVVDRRGYQGAFGLRIELGLPSDRSLNLAAVMKPLFDGVIAGLHMHTAQLDDTAVERLADALGVERDRVASELLSDESAALGGCDLVAPYRGFVKWNPEDHRCERGELVRVDGGSRSVTIAGELFALPDA